ncbi:hypothetical protein OIU76_021734 [Salix suchowensis]|nr:hypothetical protein OIU76_021734 [Salix suchowensis]
MVSSIITNNNWNLPDILHRWRGRIGQPNMDENDQYIWKGTASGKFSVSSAWNLLRTPHPKVTYSFMLWHPWHIPRHSFTLWLAIKGRLRTLDRTYGGRRGESENLCKLCNRHPETHNHLFFQCNYAQDVWRMVNVRNPFKWPEDIPWNQVWEWGATRFNCKGVACHRIPCMILATTVYHIWYERNARTFNNHFSSTAEKSEEILSTIRLKLASVEDRHTVTNEVLAQWGIDLQRDSGLREEN